MGELGDPFWSLTVFGAYLTTFSIFVVYQVLELQNWLERVSALRGEFDANPDEFKGRSARAKARRESLRQRCRRTGGRYPGFSTRVIWALQGCLFVVGLFLFTWLECVPRIYLLAAWVLLMTATTVGPALGRRRGLADIGELQRILQELEQ